MGLGGRVGGAACSSTNNAAVIITRGKRTCATGCSCACHHSSGSSVKGSLFALTVEAVQVQVGKELHTVSAGDVRRIQWQQPDSPLTGVLIGAAIGAIPGIYWLAADPNECTGMCPEEYALIAVGAIVGGTPRAIESFSQARCISHRIRFAFPFSPAVAVENADGFHPKCPRGYPGSPKCSRHIKRSDTKEDPRKASEVEGAGLILERSCCELRNEPNH